MIKGIDGACVLVGAVLEDAEVPPAFLPRRVELLGLCVELDGEGQISLVAGGCGTPSEVGKLRVGLLCSGEGGQGEKRAAEDECARYRVGEDRDGHCARASAKTGCD